MESWAPAGKALKLLMAAGEVSGDMQGAFLAQTLFGLDSTLQLYGIGGRKMQAAGVDLKVETTQFSSVGLFEAVRFFAPLRRALRRIEAIVRADRPDAAILIDNHGFNLLLARFLQREKIPVIYYFPPQVWVAGGLFADGITRNSQLIISSLEEEAAIYRKHGGRAVCVGHPLLDIAKPGANPAAALAQCGVGESRPLIALMPGSRQQEVEKLAGPMFGAAKIIKGRYPDAQFLLPVASVHLRSLLEEIQRAVGFSSDLHFAESEVYSCLSRCDLVMTTTGTSTLETALLGVPMVTAYRLQSLSAWLARKLSSVHYVAMPNLLLDDAVVPEILQRDVTAERLAQAALEILESPERQEKMRARFRQLPGLLGESGVLTRVAELILHEVAPDRRPCATAP